MRIGVLGTLAVTAEDGTVVAVGGPRPRALLVLLALNANRVVGTDAVVAAQYGDDPPAGAATPRMATRSAVSGPASRSSARTCSRASCCAATTTPRSAGTPS